MRDETTLALRPDLFGQLAATDPFQGRARRLYERGQVLAVNGNQGDVRVGYDARNNPLDLKEVPIVSGYIPRVGDWVAIHYEAGHSGAPWVAGPSMAADESEDTPGIGVFSVSSEEPADPQKSTVYFHEPASTWRGWDGAAWVDLGGGGGGLHNSLPDLQGGAAGEYYHLTAAQWNALVGNIPFGAGAVLYADSSGYIAGDADTFSWDAASKRLGIGTSAPAAQLHVSKDLYTEIAIEGGGVQLYHRPDLALYRFRGTRASKDALVSQDWLGLIRFFGWDGAAYVEGAGLRFCTDEAWSGAAHGSRIELWSADTGVASASKKAVLSDSQWKLLNGSVAAPPFSFIDYPTRGMYVTASLLGFAYDGHMRASLNSTGLGIAASGKGAFAASYPLDMRADYDGVISSYFANENAGASTAIRGYWSTSGGGDAYHLMRVNDGGSKYWAYGIDRSEADRFAWGCNTTLGPSDRMYLDRYGILWLMPYNTALTTEGEGRMCSAHKTWRWLMGTMQCLGASLVDDARTSDAHEHTSGGELAETAISTKTIQSDFSTAGNAVKVVARGTAMVNPKGAGGGATMHIKFRIEGTDVFDLSFPAAMASPARWIYYEFSFDATIRGSTSWMISSVKAEYADWQQVGNPWPCTFTPTLLRYGRDNAFAVSGDVTTQVRCSITNAAPDASFITVAEHKSGLEQV